MKNSVFVLFEMTFWLFNQAPRVWVLQHYLVRATMSPSNNAMHRVLQQWHPFDGSYGALTNAPQYGVLPAVLPVSHSSTSSPCMGRFFMPMTYSHAEELKSINELAGAYGKGAVKSIPGVLADTYRSVLDHPARLMYARDSEFSEYLVSDFSVLPLYTACLRAIYGKDQTLVPCKLCGRLYPSESNRRGFCSDACAKEQKRFIKKDFRKNHKDDPLEPLHHGAYSYFYERVKKCKAAGLPEDELNIILKAFQDFVKENLARKEQAKEIVEQGDDINGAFNSYQNWILEQENAFDTLVQSHLDAFRKRTTGDSQSET